MQIDLSTDFLGLTLENPMIVSACPLTSTAQSLKQLRHCGAAAAVLPSIFEEQIEHEEMELARMLDFWALSSPESHDYFPTLDEYNTGPGHYLELIKQAKAEVDMPIIASLNGATPGGWIRYAGLIEQAGADALELNIYQVPTSKQQSASKVAAGYVELVQALKRELSIPISVKLGPFFSSLPELADQLVQAGADGMVLFNRYLAPDIDLKSMRFVPALDLSVPQELRLALRWIAILRDQVPISLVATGGVHSASDVVKALLVGANAVACSSALIQRGPQVVDELLAGLSAWMFENEYQSVRQLQGSMSMEHCPNPEGLKRVNYMRALTSYTPGDHQK